MSETCIILTPRQYNACVGGGAINQGFLINVDISEEKDILQSRSERLEKLCRELVEFYGDKCNWKYSDTVVEGAIKNDDLEKGYVDNLDIYLRFGGKLARECEEKLNEILSI